MEVLMAQKGGKMKRIFLTLILLALIVIVFVLLGGGAWLRSAGKWLGGMGSKADDVKQTIEKKATTIEKTVEKGIEAVKPGDKK
jgi:flagellar basal body-associated protein FliL